MQDINTQKILGVTTIEDFRRITLSNPKALFSGGTLVLLGILVALSSLAYPLIGSSLDGDIALFAALIPLVGVIVSSLWLLLSQKKKMKNSINTAKSMLHPLMQQILRAFMVPTVIVIAGILLITNLTMPSLALPLILMVIGFKVTILSALTVPKIAKAGWFFIIGGFLGIALAQFDISNLAFYLCAYLGFGLSILGFSSIQKAGSR